MNLTEIPRMKRGHILIKLMEAKETKKNGLYVPGQQTKVFTDAEVVAVGDDMPDYKMETKVGDKILVKDGLRGLAVLPLIINNEDYWIIREESGFYGWL